MRPRKFSMDEVISKRIIEEMDKLDGWQDFYSEANRRKHKTGGHRLKHLVPELGPDQPALARLLAAFAIQHRGDDFSDKGSVDAWKDFRAALGKDHKIQKLVDRAPHDAISWQACEYFLDPAYRTHIRRIDGAPIKYVAPIPEPIVELRDQCFRGEVERPKYSSLELRNGAIVFAVRLALEAGDITATSSVNKPNACQIVSDQLKGFDIHIDTVLGAWRDRECKPDSR